jgi:hypothetical protein
MSKRHVMKPSEQIIPAGIGSRTWNKFDDIPGGIVAAIAIVHLTTREKSLRRPRGITELRILTTAVRI